MYDQSSDSLVPDPIEGGGVESSVSHDHPLHHGAKAPSRISRWEDDDVVVETLCANAEVNAINADLSWTSPKLQRMVETQRDLLIALNIPEESHPYQLPMDRPFCFSKSSDQNILQLGFWPKQKVVLVAVFLFSSLSMGRLVCLDSSGIFPTMTTLSPVLRDLLELQSSTLPSYSNLKSIKLGRSETCIV